MAFSIPKTNIYHTTSKAGLCVSCVRYLKIPLLQNLLPPPHQKGGAHVEMEMGEALRFSLTSERRASTRVLHQALNATFKIGIHFTSLGSFSAHGTNHTRPLLCFTPHPGGTAEFIKTPDPDTFQKHRTCLSGFPAF